MGRGKKRKYPAAESFPSYNVPTLKEYAWECLSFVLRKHLTVSLADKSDDNAMKKFRCVRVLLFQRISTYVYLVPGLDWIGSLL
jgi:hypothetical protein